MIPLLMFALISTVHADVAPEESMSFVISMTQQSCTQGETKEQFICSSDPPRDEVVQVNLHSVSPNSIEDQAYEGKSEEIGINLPGNVGQYIPRVNVRKSAVGSSAIYTVRFSAFQLMTSTRPTSFETVWLNEGPPGRGEIISLVTDRLDHGPRGFKQVSFTLRPQIATNPPAARNL